MYNLIDIAEKDYDTEVLNNFLVICLYEVGSIAFHYPSSSQGVVEYNGKYYFDGKYESNHLNNYTLTVRNTKSGKISVLSFRAAFNLVKSKNIDGMYIIDDYNHSNKLYILIRPLKEGYIALQNNIKYLGVREEDYPADKPYQRCEGFTNAVAGGECILHTYKTKVKSRSFMSSYKTTQYWVHGEQNVCMYYTSVYNILHLILQGRLQERDRFGRLNYNLSDDTLVLYSYKPYCLKGKHYIKVREFKWCLTNNARSVINDVALLDNYFNDFTEVVLE